MAASYSDQQFLAADPTFANRVRQSLITLCITITTVETASSAGAQGFHRERQTYAVAVMNQPDTFKAIFAQAAAANGSVISDATANGTVVLTSGNSAAQATLVTDAHLDAAMGIFNAFFRTPGN